MGVNNSKPNDVLEIRVANLVETATKEVFISAGLALNDNQRLALVGGSKFSSDM